MKQSFKSSISRIYFPGSRKILHWLLPTTSFVWFLAELLPFYPKNTIDKKVDSIDKKRGSRKKVWTLFSPVVFCTEGRDFATIMEGVRKSRSKFHNGAITGKEVRVLKLCTSPRSWFWWCCSPTPFNCKILFSVRWCPNNLASERSEASKVSCQSRQRRKFAQNPLNARPRLSFR